MTTRRLFIGAAAAALASPYVLSPAHAQQISMRLQGFLPAASPTHRAFEKLVADLDTKSGGRLKIQALPVGGAVGPAETLNAIAAGVLDGHYSSSSFFAARDAGFTVFGDTGASYDTVDARDRWWREGGGEALGKELYAQFGIEYVANVFWPSEHIPARRALNGVDDLRGLKIRVPPGMIAEIFGRAGAAVINLPAGEVFNALQSGVIDATDWASPGQNMEVGLYRAARFSVNAAHSMPATEVCFAKRRWDTIPAELRTLIETEVRAMSVALKAQIQSDDDAALTRLRADGVQIITWPREEIAKLRRLTGEVQDTLAARSPIARKIIDSHRTFQTRLG
jgi:TRAP-type mannitol/chloroaromatic compound transport system substrate-binding protein